MVESKINIQKEEYIKQFSPDMMEITYNWLEGHKFAELFDTNKDIFEGTIIRCLRRLDELLTQMNEGAKIIGNNLLQQKINECQTHLKRGIVFAASLYL